MNNRPAPLKEWLERHLALTREERLLVAGILLIVLCGLGVRYFQSHHPAKTDAAAEIATP